MTAAFGWAMAAVMPAWFRLWSSHGKQVRMPGIGILLQGIEAERSQKCCKGTRINHILPEVRIHSCGQPDQDGQIVDIMLPVRLCVMRAEGAGASESHERGESLLMQTAGKYEEILERAPMDGIAEVPAYATYSLENALQRYLAIHCVTRNVIPMKQVLKDRSDYYHLYEPAVDGQAMLDDEKQVEFMYAVTGHPKEWCAAWIYMDLLHSIADGAVEGDPDDLIWEGYDSVLYLSGKAGLQ